MATTYADFIKANPTYVGNAAAAPPQPQGVHGRGGFLSSIISELGGAGGAAGGAAIGTALLPGVGTLIGAGLGGLIGGTGGKAIEQKVRDNQNFLGAGGSAKKAFTEGGIDAALSAGGEALSGAKAASAAGEPLSAIFSKTPAELKALSATGDIGNLGSRTLADARGIVPGAKAGGTTLTTEQAANYNDFLNGVTKASDPRKQLADLEAHINGVGKQIGNAVATNNRTLTSTEIKSLQADARAALGKTAGLGADRPAVQQYIKDLGKVKDLQGLQDFTQSVGGQTRFQPGAVVNPKVNQALQGINKVGSDFLKTNVPGLEELHPSYSNAKDIQPFLQGAVRNPNGLKSPIALSKFGVPEIGGNPAATAKAAIGRATSKVGGLGAAFGGSNATDGVINQLAKGTAQNLKFQVPGHLLGGASAAVPGSTDVLGAQNDQGVAPNTPGQNGLGGAFQPPPPTQSQYPISSALADIARDPKNASTYLAINKAADAAASAADKTNSGSAQQQKAIFGAQNAMQALDTIQKQFAAAGGGQGALAGRLADIGAKVNINPNLAQYNSKKTDAALQLAIGLFGANAGRSPQIISKIRDSLPDAQDSQAVANAKIEGLRQSILATLNDAALYGQTGANNPTAPYDPTQNSPAYLQQQQSALAGGF